MLVCGRLCLCIEDVIVFGKVNVTGSSDRIALSILREAFQIDTLVIQILNNLIE